MKKIIDTIKSKITGEEVSTDGLSDAEKALELGGGETTVKDVVAPDGLVIKEDHLCLGGRYVRIHHITELPRHVHTTWLEEVYSIGDVDVSIHMYPAKTDEVINELSGRIDQYETQRIVMNRKGRIDQESYLKSLLADANQLRDLLQTGRDKMIYCSIQIAVADSTLEGLDRKSRMLEEILGGKNSLARSAFLRQIDGLKSVVPLGRNLLSDVYHNLNLQAAATLFPFNNAEVSHTDGVDWGINRFQGTPVVFDVFKLNNHNVAVFGESGSGKSSFVKLYVARSAIRGIRTAAIDPDGEYNRLCNWIGGTMMRFESDRFSGINPFDIEAEYDEDMGEEVVKLLDKISEIISLISVMVESRGEKLTTKQLSILDRVVKAEYFDRGINEMPESLFEPYEEPDMIGYRRKNMPTFSSLTERLKAEGQEDLCLLLEPYVAGGTMGIFDGQSNVTLHNVPFICFDVSRLEEGLMRPLAMHVILQWIWEKFIKKNFGVKKQVIVDEAWQFMKYKDSAKFLETMARRCRKQIASLITATQSFYEFTDREEGKSVLTNSGTKFLMKQNSTDLESVTKIMQLPEGQIDVLRQINKGEGLLLSSRAVAAVSVVVAPFEMEIIKTGVSALEDNAS